MNVAEAKQKILLILKERGEATTAELAEALEVTYEATRQQIKQLETAGLVALQERANPAGVGRPSRYYRLSVAGDHAFYKAYELLATGLIDALVEASGKEALRKVLAEMSEKQAAQWTARLAGLGLEERLLALKDYYLEDDPFVEVRRDGDALQLVEHNCPFLSTALARPALCSVTVSTLERLLQRPVRRVRRFQDGDGRCVFHVQADTPLAEGQRGFRFEDEVRDVGAGEAADAENQPPLPK